MYHEFIHSKVFLIRSHSHPEELLNRHFSRDNRAPAREIPDHPTESASSTATADQLTKLERNLRRFEEERRRFDDEKRRFEQEKRDAETALRNRRLQAFQRRRDERQQADAVDADVHQKLCSILRVIEDQHQQYRLPGISPARPVRTAAGWRTSSGEEFASPSSQSGSPLPVVVVKAPPPPLPAGLTVLGYPNDSASASTLAEDYESSTAKSLSSRAGDFDDEEAENDDEFEVTVTEDPPANAANCRTNDEPPATVVEPPPAAQPSWLRRLFRRPAKPPPARLPAPTVGPVSLTRFCLVETRLVWHQLLAEHATEWAAARRCRNRCFADLVVLLFVCGLGGLTFRFVEGSFENFYKCGVRRVKRDFVDHLWTTSHNLREDDWKQVAREKLRSFEEELHAAHEAGMTSYSGMKAWTFVNGLIYCLTVITTIGKRMLAHLFALHFTMSPVSVCRIRSYLSEHKHRSSNHDCLCNGWHTAVYDSTQRFRQVLYVAHQVFGGVFAAPGKHELVGTHLPAGLRAGV